MAASRRQPSTIDTQRVTTRDQRQESRNKTQSSKKQKSKFNSGINVEAVFSAISQLLETFTSQVLDNTGLNMSLLLRTIYRNLDDDMVGILSEQSNVDAINKFLAEKNAEIVKASGKAPETPTGEQLPAQPEPVPETISVTKETLPDEIIQHEPEQHEQTLPRVEEPVSVEEVEGESTTSRTEVETSEEKTVETKKSKPLKFSPTQKLCALGEADDENLDLLTIVRDFTSELTNDIWALSGTIQGIRELKESRYEEFKDEVEDNDEDDYEWNLYRYMYEKQREVLDERREKIDDIVKERLARRKALNDRKATKIAPRREPLQEPKTKDLLKTFKETILQKMVQNSVVQSIVKNQVTEKTITKEVKESAPKGRRGVVVARRQPMKALLPAPVRRAVEKARDKEEIPSEIAKVPAVERKIRARQATSKRPPAVTPKISQRAVARRRSPIAARRVAKNASVGRREFASVNRARTASRRKSLPKPVFVRLAPPAPVSIPLMPAPPVEKLSLFGGKTFIKNITVAKSTFNVFPTQLVSKRTLKVIRKKAKATQTKEQKEEKKEDKQRQKKKQSRRSSIEGLEKKKSDETKGFFAKIRSWFRPRPKLSVFYTRNPKDIDLALPYPSSTKKRKKGWLDGTFKAMSVRRTLKKLQATKKNLPVERKVVYKIEMTVPKAENGIREVPVFQIVAVEEEREATPHVQENSFELIPSVLRPAKLQRLLLAPRRKQELEETPTFEQPFDDRDFVQPLEYRRAREISRRRSASFTPPKESLALHIKGGVKAVGEKLGLVKRDDVSPVVIVNEPLQRSRRSASAWLSDTFKSRIREEDIEDVQLVEEPSQEISTQEIPPQPRPKKPLVAKLPAVERVRARRATSTGGLKSTQRLPTPTSLKIDEEPRRSPSIAAKAVEMAKNAFYSLKTTKENLGGGENRKVEQPTVAPSSPGKTLQSKSRLPVPPLPSRVIQRTERNLAKGNPAREKPARSRMQDLLSVPRSMLAKLRGLQAQQNSTNKENERRRLPSSPAIPNAPALPPPSAPAVMATPKGLVARERMSDEEAYQRNMEEGLTQIQMTLFGKDGSKRFSLPNNQIGRSLARVMELTGVAVRQTEKDLTKVEDAINNQDRGGLLKKILNGLLTVALLFIGGGIVFGLFKMTFKKWVPLGQDGKMLHGPSLFGIRLPSFGDLFRMGRAAYYFVRNIIQKAWIVGKKIVKAIDFKAIGGLLKTIPQIAKGVITGIGINATMWAVKFLGPIGHSIASAIRIGGFVVGFAFECFKSLLGKGGLIRGPIENWIKKRKEREEFQRASFEQGATENALAGMESAAGKVKTLVPMESVLPREMTARGASKEGLPKAIIPKMGFVKRFEKATENEQKLSKKSDEAKQKTKAVIKAGSERAGALVKRVGGKLSEVPEKGRFGRTLKPAERKKRAFILLAKEEIKKLRKARKRVETNFVPQNWYNRQANVKDWIDEKTGKWNQRWVYAGPNQSALWSAVPRTAFAPIQDQPMYRIARPYKQQDYGILPLSFEITATGVKATGDAHEWERERIDTAIYSWKQMAWAADYYGVGEKGFNSMAAKEGKRWTEISIYPNFRSRMSTEQMIHAWNDWHKRHAKDKKKAQKKPAIPKPIPPPPKGRGSALKTGLKKVAKVYKKTAKAAAVVLAAPVLLPALPLVFAVKTIAKTVKKRNERKDAKRRAEEERRKREFGIMYIDSVLKGSPWKELATGKAKNIRRALGIDEWFKKEPPGKEKYYKKGPAKVAYNILTEMGFVYDKNVWTNPQFLKVRDESFRKLADSVNVYVNSILQNYLHHLKMLRKIGDANKTPDAQAKIQEAARSTVEEFGRKATFKSFMEFVARTYKPAGIHLVVRDKTGKIIKEEGKELKAFEVPEDIYNTDPKTWDAVKDAMDNPMEGEKAGWFKLRTQRRKLNGGLKYIVRRNKEIARIAAYQAKVSARLNKLFVANMAMTGAALRMYSRNMARLRKQIQKAKRDIRRYFRRRLLLSKGPIGLAMGAVAGAGRLAGKVIKGALGVAAKGVGAMKKGIAGMLKRGTSFLKLGAKKLGARKNKRLLDAISKLRSEVNAVAGKNKRGLKRLKGKFAKRMKKLKKENKAKNLKIVKSIKKRQANVKKRIDSVAKINTRMFGLFNKRALDEQGIKMHTEELAKEMLPNQDEIGKSRIRYILKLAQERRDSQKKDHEQVKSYWAELKRRWQDRISEESMRELKEATGRVSNSILDYMAMVHEMPEGSVVVMQQQVTTLPKKFQLLGDIAF